MHWGSKTHRNNGDSFYYVYVQAKKLFDFWVINAHFSWYLANLTCSTRLKLKEHIKPKIESVYEDMRYEDRHWAGLCWLRLPEELH